MVSYWMNKHKIVHLDLKGAPWKAPYIQQIFEVIKSWNATGVLIEWEDTFPYTGDMVEIGSLGGCGGDGLYSKDEVKTILELAKIYDLEVIQLVQTIGHLEFVLKHPKFKHLRERPQSPAVFCPTNQGSLVLIKAMVDQALEAQPDAKYFHIGADEVWYLAECDQCRRRVASSPHGPSSLFLQHVRDVVSFIKNKRPDLTVLMWDDMLRNINSDTLKVYNLGELVLPVMWDYNRIEYFRINPQLWTKYQENFPKTWAASAFKGANGSCKAICDVGRYVSNHVAWNREVKENESKIHFAGIILTGWSRYDHYATMCELLPEALLSLRCCLSTLEMNEAITSHALSDAEWPGKNLALGIDLLERIKQRVIQFTFEERVATWMNPWQLSHRYMNPCQIQGILVEAEALLDRLNKCRNDIKIELDSITGCRSVEEWINTNIGPYETKLVEMVLIAKSLPDASIAP